ncbi:MAG TPA: hypothetical protein VHB99_12765 [Pirellulales bacterium]|nr:hypothetical protein [Pirellulales bacterium]
MSDRAGKPKLRYARRGQASLAWALASYLALQLAISAASDDLIPELRDPEYGRKLALLETRLAESPRRPLMLILGSSRAGLGLLPGEFPFKSSPAEQPLVFNFALTGAGPVRELQTFQRLLAAGIRPRQVLVEIHPLLLHGGPGFGELASLDASRLDWPDIRLLTRYFDRPQKLRLDWCRSRLAPCFFQRFCWLHYFSPRWLAPNDLLFIWNRLDRCGGLQIELPAGSERQFDQRVADSIREYAPAFDRFHVTEAPDRALRELLSLCREREIAAALFLMPEEERFRAAYSTEARAEVKAYLSALRSEYGCAVLAPDNCRPIADCAASNFVDGHHLSAPGARRFSEWFGAEIFARMETPPGAERRLPRELREAGELAKKREPGPSPQLR